MLVRGSSKWRPISYRSQVFRQACADHGLRHLRTRPYTPRTNGKAERFIQTSLREWAYAQPYISSQQRCAALTAWLDQYNSARPHTALGGCPPAARLRQHQLLCSTQGTVASSRPASTNDHSVGLGQGSPKATGFSRQRPCGSPPYRSCSLDEGPRLKYPTTILANGSLRRKDPRELAIGRIFSRHKLHMRVVGVKRAFALSLIVSGPALSFFSYSDQLLTDVSLWSCGRRTSVVQAQRQIHRVLAPYTVGGQRTRFPIEIAALR